CCAQTSLYQGRSSFSISAFSNSYTHGDFTLTFARIKMPPQYTAETTSEFFLFALTLPHQREQQYVADGWRIGQQHDQSVDADT
ncbi:hypothetical protein SAMN05421868_15518, partial [Paenibacillus naphthalenovorans]